MGPCLRCHRFHWDVWIWASFKLSLRSFQVLVNRDGDSGLLGWESSASSPSCSLGDDSSGASSGYCLFCLLIFLRLHQALTKCPNHCLSRILHKLGWPYGSCLLTSSGGCQSQPEGSKGLVLFHFHIFVKLLTVFWNPGKSPYQHLGWLALLGISFPGLSWSPGLHLE